MPRAVENRRTTQTVKRAGMLERPLHLSLSDCAYAVCTELVSHWPIRRDEAARDNRADRVPTAPAGRAQRTDSTTGLEVA
jgi:hypothetical protein